MKTFLLILFFSKFILLTPDPVTLNSKWLEITPDDSFSAITGGANLRIQIPIDDYRIKKTDKNGNIFKQLGELFPDGSIEAIIYGEKNHTVHLSRRSFAISDFQFLKDKSLHITLHPSGLMPTKIEFKSIKIKSDPEIKNVKVYWKNYKH